MNKVTVILLNTNKVKLQRENQTMNGPICELQNLRQPFQKCIPCQKYDVLVIG